MTTSGSNGTRYPVSPSTTTSKIPPVALATTGAPHAMRRLDHREPGIPGAVLDTHSLYAELICDGIHVAPEFVRLWLGAKGEERAILVTDGISATGMPDGNYMLGELEVTVANGRCLSTCDLASGKQTLAGSVLSMDPAVANPQTFTGVGSEVLLSVDPQMRGSISTEGLIAAPGRSVYGDAKAQ